MFRLYTPGSERQFAALQNINNKLPRKELMAQMEENSEEARALQLDTCVLFHYNVENPRAAQFVRQQVWLYYAQHKASELEELKSFYLAMANPSENDQKAYELINSDLTTILSKNSKTLLQQLEELAPEFASTVKDQGLARVNKDSAPQFLKVRP